MQARIGGRRKSNGRTLPVEGRNALLPDAVSWADDVLATSVMVYTYRGEDNLHDLSRQHLAGLAYFCARIPTTRRSESARQAAVTSLRQQAVPTIYVINKGSCALGIPSGGQVVVFSAETQVQASIPGHKSRVVCVRASTVSYNMIRIIM